MHTLDLFHPIQIWRYEMTVQTIGSTPWIRVDQENVLAGEELERVVEEQGGGDRRVQRAFVRFESVAFSELQQMFWNVAVLVHTTAGEVLGFQPAYDDDITVEGEQGIPDNLIERIFRSQNLRIRLTITDPNLQLSPQVRIENLQ